MDTLVVNKHKYRPTLDMLPDDVYIGRPGPWGNPFILGVHGNRDQVCELFKTFYAKSKDPKAQWMRDHIHELKGKTLICWCDPLRCHGHFLAMEADKTHEADILHTPVKLKTKESIIEKIEMDHKPITEFTAPNDFLSNFFPCFIFGYPTLEHAYQAAKCVYPVDRERIRALYTPGEAKRFGRKATMRPDWDKNKLEVMHQLVRYKFVTFANLQRKLLATGNSLLQEGNYWGDTYWGVCNGEGENHLGLILMAVRSEIRRSKEGVLLDIFTKIDSHSDLFTKSQSL